LGPSKGPSSQSLTTSRNIWSLPETSSLSAFAPPPEKYRALRASNGRFFHDRERRARIPLEMSNFYCRPDKSGESPLILERPAEAVASLRGFVGIVRA
jgi:hypothetical protein